MHQIATHRGQRAALDLADGSQVVLAAESRLRIPYAYGPSRGPREVFLEGEAYFKVKRDDRRPFRVHVTRGVAEAHAGAFDVAAYPETQSLEVVTTNDSVALRTSPEIDPSAPVFLTLAPGELGQVDSMGNATIARDASWATRVAWVTGTLVFEGTPMRDIAHRIGRWYDLDIYLADSALADRKLTIAFAGGTAEQVLALLGSTLKADVERQGHTVVFRSKTR
jgi:ferric-dicitrate binding protein FerR (iron transport regulator)